MADRSAEARETYDEMVALRSRIEAGELPWSALADYFTDNAVYIDSAWGRFEGRDTIKKFMDDSMAGLADWRFPEEWTMVDGDRVVSMWWNQLPGQRADGSPYRVAGLSILRYAGNRKFDYEYDVFNMVQVLDVIAESGWQPTGPMNAPPQQPNRDTSFP
jgi:ketosteroid isomerase-like protein